MTAAGTVANIDGLVDRDVYGDRRESTMFCRIKPWRGYVAGEFHAVVGDGSSSALLARSKSFSWFRKTAEPPDTRQVRSRLKELCRTLEADGWVREDAGTPERWFDIRFHHPTARDLIAAGPPSEQAQAEVARHADVALPDHPAARAAAAADMRPVAQPREEELSRSDVQPRKAEQPRKGSLKDVKPPRSEQELTSSQGEQAVEPPPAPVEATRFDHLAAPRIDQATPTRRAEQVAYPPRVEATPPQIERTPLPQDTRPEMTPRLEQISPQVPDTPPPAAREEQAVAPDYELRPRAPDLPPSRLESGSQPSVEPEVRNLPFEQQLRSLRIGRDRQKPQAEPSAPPPAPEPLPTVSPRNGAYEAQLETNGQAPWWTSPRSDAGPVPRKLDGDVSSRVSAYLEELKVLDVRAIDPLPETSDTSGSDTRPR